MPTAFITGINGQDGAYLAHFLLAKGYRVVGGVRGVLSDVASDIEYSNLQAFHIRKHIEFRPFDLLDTTSMRHALEQCAPDEIYHLAAQSSVGASWTNPIEVGETTGLGAARLFQVAREVCPKSRIFQASSSEMFGSVAINQTATGRVATGQTAIRKVDENTLLSPGNPYGAAKTYAHHMAKSLRQSHGMAISCGILFNHESPLRPASFVTRKITMSVARIKRGLQNSLSLGNLDVVRDWGFAGDFVRAMWLMLQQEPDDFILATGVTRPLRDFVEESFRCVDLASSEFVRIDPAFFRLNETPPILGDNSKSRTRLGWKAEVSFEKLVQMMVEADLNRLDGKTEAVRYFAN